MMDPYKVLGVAQGATQDEIKNAYRTLAKKLHPDLNPGNKVSENKFKEVSKAYELIGTADMRAKFDRGETDEQQQQQWQNQSRQGPAYHETQRPGGRYSMNAEDFDPSIFADLFGGARQHARRSNLDEYFSLEVDFTTAIMGGERDLSLPSGKKLRVKIPAGIKSGTKLRFAGQGAQTVREASPGSIYVEILVKPSAQFKRVDNDIEIELPLALHEAILGTELKVPTVDGGVLLKIPAGISAGSRIRIKGKGVPTKQGRGDQFAVVKLVMPSKVDPELEKFAQEWRQTHAYNPRVGQGWEQ